MAEQEKRDRFVHFVMSPSEYARMRQKMEEIGITSQSAYIRKMLLDGYCINLNLAEIREMVRLLRYYGNNLNQYAKRANENGSIYYEDIHDLQNQLDEIWKAVRELLAKLAEIQ